MHKKINFKSESGFTLMELMVVIGVLAILIAILLPQFTGYTAQAQAISAASEMKNALTAGYSYYTSVTARGDGSKTFEATTAIERMKKASNPDATITGSAANAMSYSVKKGNLTFSTTLDLTTGTLGKKTAGAGGAAAGALDGTMQCSATSGNVCDELKKEGALQIQ